MDAAAEGSLRPLVSGSVSGLHITTRGGPPAHSRTHSRSTPPSRGVRVPLISANRPHGRLDDFSILSPSHDLGIL